MPFRLQEVHFTPLTSHLTLLRSEKGGVHYISRDSR
jgi:hypothetical protein